MFDFPDANKLRERQLIRDNNEQFGCKRYVESQLRETLNTPGFLDDDGANHISIRATREYDVNLVFKWTKDVLSGKGYDFYIVDNSVMIKW